MSSDYVFRVTNNDNGIKGYVHYTKEENRLICALEEFENEHRLLGSLEVLVLYLKSKKLTRIITFFPDTEKVCSHPYEITSEDDFQACEADGLWYKSHHQGLEDDDIKYLAKEGITTSVLNQREEEKLNSELDYYPE